MNIEIDGKDYVVKEGMSQAVMNAFKKGADVVVKKACQKCGFQMPAFSGRYPNNCPVCGSSFAGDLAESFGAFLDGNCVGILEKAEVIVEGAFGEQDIEINEIVDWVVGLAKKGIIKSKADLNEQLKNLKTGKTGTTYSIDTIKNNFSEIVKRIGKKMKDENVKL